MESQSEQPAPIVVPMPSNVSNTKIWWIIGTTLTILAVGIIAWFWVAHVPPKPIEQSTIATTTPSTITVLTPPTYNWISLSTNKGTDYVKKGGTIYFEDVAFPNADPSTFAFAVMQSTSTYDYGTYAKDAGHVYYIESGQCQAPTINTVVNADPTTFAPVLGLVQQGCHSSTSYAKDKNYMYVNEQALAGADPQTFVLIKDSQNQYFTDYAKDKTHVYCVAASSPTPLDGADPSTFISFGDPTYGYAKDKNHVYANDCKILTGADPLTFAPLSIGQDSFYGKDKSHVYYWGQMTQGDPHTLSLIGVLSEPFGDGYTYGGEYVKDKDHVYFGGGGSGSKIISGADVATFVLVDSIGNECGANCQFDAHDKNHTYYRSQIVR